jgi:hypothetical protein
MKYVVFLAQQNTNHANLGHINSVSFNLIIQKFSAELFECLLHRD